jgi:hypothetical protein
MSSADRRRTRSHRATEALGKQADAALDTLALLDFAWLDCDSEPSPPDAVLEDIREVSGGNLAQFIVAAHLALIDLRDLRVWADGRRFQTDPGEPLSRALAALAGCGRTLGTLREG